MSSATFAGKPLVVNFFTAETCDWTGALLSGMHRDYAGAGLQIVGINLFDEGAAIESCISKHAVHYPILRGDAATQQAWIGKSEGWATFFVTAEGKIFKAISNSMDNGLESVVFPKYAESLLDEE